MVMSDELVLSAGHQLRSRAGPLAEAVVACEFRRHPALRARYGPIGASRSREETVQQVWVLADSIDARSPALFNDHVAWLKVLMLQRGVLAEDLMRRLACMADTVREQMPPPVSRPAITLLEGALAALPGMACTSTSWVDGGPRRSPLAADYLHALLGGYRQAAGRLVFEAAAGGETVGALYQQVLQPALREVGRLWQTGRVSVAQEHFCSAATQMLMAQLLLRAGLAPPCGHTVLVACVSGDRHELGARMVSDFFEMAGWDAFFCGADTPGSDIVQTAVDRAADVLALSTTMACHLHRTQELIAAIRADTRCAGLRVMVGGHPFHVDPTLWHTLGADGTAADAEAAVRLAGTWMESAASRA